jgi:hypothetical protein
MVTELRPITPQIITETLNLLKKEKNVTCQDVENSLQVSSDRAREILTQLNGMCLVGKVHNFYFLSNEGNAFFESIVKEDTNALDGILSCYPPYNQVKLRLKNKAASNQELVKELGFTGVAIDSIIRLIAWTNRELSLNTENGRYYFETKKVPSIDEFCMKLYQAYSDIIESSYFNVKTLYVKISRIQNNVCEVLGISEKFFNELLIETLRNSKIEIELASAPTLTLQKNNRAFRLPNSNIPYYYLRITGGKK